MTRTQKCNVEYLERVLTAEERKQFDVYLKDFAGPYSWPLSSMKAAVKSWQATIVPDRIIGVDAQNLNYRRR